MRVLYLIQTTLACDMLEGASRGKYIVDALTICDGVVRKEKPRFEPGFFLWVCTIV